MILGSYNTSQSENSINWCKWKKNVYVILKILNVVLVLFSCGLGDQYSIDAINFIIAKQDSTKLSIFINKKTTSTMFMSVLIVMLVQIRTYVPTSTRLWLFDVNQHSGDI